MTGPHRFSEVSGFILAGGASRRMGIDKTQLPVGRERIVDRQIRLLRFVCASVSILGPRDKFADAAIQVFEDEVRGQGPLGGIYTGLRKSRSEFSLFVSCDMPLMEVRFLRYLCKQALASRALATLPPPTAKRRYPLCAVLRRRALWRVRHCLASGQTQVGLFFSRCPQRTISKAEFARAGFSPRIFYNVNTPEEYERLQQPWVR